MNLRLNAPTRAALSATLASAALLCGASAASAATCSATPTLKTFASLGDSADYSLAPGGNFESTMSGWTLGGASVVSGNESLFLGNKRDVKSLSVPAKAVVTSAPFCVGIEHPAFRFVARQASGSWATLLVKLRVTDAGGRVNTVTVGAINSAGPGKWAATPAIKLATVLPLWAAGQSSTVQVVLDPEDTGGSWQVDDLYIDPFRRS